MANNDNFIEDVSKRILSALIFGSLLIYGGSHLISELSLADNMQNSR
jgi:hypothetical protein